MFVYLLGKFLEGYIKTASKEEELGIQGVREYPVHEVSCCIVCQS